MKVNEKPSAEEFKFKELSLFMLKTFKVKFGTHCYYCYYCYYYSGTTVCLVYHCIIRMYLCVVRSYVCTHMLCFCVCLCVTHVAYLGTHSYVSLVCVCTFMCVTDVYVCR